MSFTARYHGPCAATECPHGHVNPGDDVEWTEDHEIVHVDCNDPDRPAPAPVEVCGECWMAKPCWCDPP